MFDNEIDLSLRVSDELVNRDYCRDTVVITNVRDVSIEVGQPFLECLKVFLGQILSSDTTVEFQGTDRGDQYRRRWANTSRAALDINELLRTEVGAKARFGHHVVSQSKARCCCNDAITTMRDVGKRTAMNKGRCALKGLHEIGRQRVLQYRRQRTFGLKVSGGHRLTIAGVSNDDATQTCF